MNLTDFKQTLSADNPPADISIYLEALWYEAKEQWNKAHELVQDLPDKNASWIHAYLHRKEGDTGNADYWYNKANKKRPAISLSEEWEQLATQFLEKGTLPQAATTHLLNPSPRQATLH